MTSMITARVDAKKRKAAEKVFDDIGLTTSGAVNLFICAVAMSGGIPFPVGSSRMSVMRFGHAGNPFSTAQTLSISANCCWDTAAAGTRTSARPRNPAFDLDLPMASMASPRTSTGNSTRWTPKSPRCSHECRHEIPCRYACLDLGRGEHGSTFRNRKRHSVKPFL